jgi:endonuclease/exonuclease/phosphatase family metal-dependent hydrolase
MRRITVLQWNVQSSEDIRHIREYLEKVQPDVACLQELTIGHRAQGYVHGPKFLAAQLGYRCAFVEVPIAGLDGSAITLANAVLTIGTIQRSKTVLLSQQADERGFEFESRGYVVARVRMDEAEFLTATTHLGYSRGFRMTERRLEEARNLMREVSKAKHGYVLAGDFNATPDSVIITELGLKLKSAGPKFSIPTWTTKRFSYDGFHASTLNWRLDYVFVTRDIQVVSAEVLESPYSDHRPILCEVLVRSANLPLSLDLRRHE